MNIFNNKQDIYLHLALHLNQIIFDKQLINEQLYQITQDNLYTKIYG